MANLTKEVSTLKDELRLAKSSSGVKASSNLNALSNRKSVQVSNPGNLRRATSVEFKPVDTSKWLDDDFTGAKIKNFDEMRENFIESLTNQFSDLLVPGARNSVKIPSTGISLLAEGNSVMVTEEDGDEERKSVDSADSSENDELIDLD